MSLLFSRLTRVPIRHIRHLSTAQRRAHSSIPTTAHCPSPTCPCASAPSDLDIDRTTPLLNTMAAYSQQIILCTGQSDWHSNIEQDSGPTQHFVQGIKGVIGKGSPGFDPFNNVLITASSLPAGSDPHKMTALLFPSFKRIPSLLDTPDAFQNFATAYLRAKTLHPMHDKLSASQKKSLLRDESVAKSLPAAENIIKPTILICGHGGRDTRCGVMGPILQDSFTNEMQRKGIEADVGVISHIGGHKFAGNVIIYLPPNMQGNSLRGSGIWYGRVGPEQVEGIVEETVVQGRVVSELLRGGVNQEGGDIGRMVELQIREKKGLGKDEGSGALNLRPKAR